MGFDSICGGGWGAVLTSGSGVVGDRVHAGVAVSIFGEVKGGHPYRNRPAPGYVGRPVLRYPDEGPNGGHGNLCPGTAPFTGNGGHGGQSPHPSVFYRSPHKTNVSPGGAVGGVVNYAWP